MDIAEDCPLGGKLGGIDIALFVPVVLLDGNGGGGLTSWLTIVPTTSVLVDIECTLSLSF